MADGPTYRVKFRRRRQGRTNYRHRLGLLRSGKPRLVVRMQNANTVVQFLGYAPTGDLVIAGGSARDLAKLGWNRAAANEPTAYLAGLLVGSRAKAAGVTEAVLDVGQQVPDAGRIRAALQGVLDAGVEVPHGDGYAADEERIAGKHMGDDVVALVQSVKSKIEEAA